MSYDNPYSPRTGDCIHQITTGASMITKEEEKRDKIQELIDELTKCIEIDGDDDAYLYETNARPLLESYSRELRSEAIEECKGVIVERLGTDYLQDDLDQLKTLLTK